MRSIDSTFIDDLLTGELAPFLQEVKSRPEQLSLEVRGGYINKSLHDLTVKMGYEEEP